MAEDQREVEHVLEDVNRSSGGGWRPVRRFDRGTRGAWLVRDGGGIERVLKWDVRGDMDQEAIRRARRVTEVLARTGAPVPRYTDLAPDSSAPQWLLMQRMHGDDAPLTEAIVQQMIGVVERQRSLGLIATGGRNDWTERITEQLRSGQMAATVADASPDGRRLADEVTLATRPLLGRVGGHSDVVHGDFQHYNALAGPDGRLTGIIDWEGSGCGDRGIDLARLRVDAIVNAVEGGRADPAIVNRLTAAGEHASGRDAFRLFTGYYALQVANFALRSAPDRSHEYIEAMRDALDLRERTVSTARRPAARTRSARPVASLSTF